jgi:hypothetical protein
MTTMMCLSSLLVLSILNLDGISVESFGFHHHLHHPILPDGTTHAIRHHWIALNQQLLWNHHQEELARRNEEFVNWMFFHGHANGIENSVASAVAVPVTSAVAASSSSSSASSLSSSFTTAIADAASTTTVVGFGGDIDIMSIVQTVGIGVTAVLFLLAGLTYLTASILIPAGAQQLELECQQFIPGTWKEYLDKLEPNQQIKDRPDLMFELGLLLNKAKADALYQYCQDHNELPLWNDFQAKLASPEQSLQDRPELIEQLSRELGRRAVIRMKAAVSPEIWEKYEAQLQPGQNLSDRMDLLVSVAT